MDNFIPRLGLFLLATVTAAGSLVAWSEGAPAGWLVLLGIAGMVALAVWALCDRGTPDDSDNSDDAP